MRALPALAALLLITACGPAPVQEAPVNAEDVMFVQMMVPHHRQGIEIAKVGAERATTPELRTLAAAIASTQQSEVERMLRWLHSWDQPLTPPNGAHDHHGGMPETDVKRIQALRKSKNFEHDLLNLLIAHQDDAVQMAAAEVAGGANPAVQEWAGQVRTSRKGQVEIMMKLLKR
ncbi:DUF305 domain-containing protein [Nonomuraea jabiensis]|uniref:Uncharacterized protein (DUF305 family) n=1 Tax=Nonomuraea jabiensis TaxID=882448 RepID=A0A7W9G257_9ACTN|nr:DUF305 domain-containing protein [Nonomuraea jabiensis]MBB5775719.1 uncharacterized protein (DUF305 family) [Nonomuraea jabiensis]